MQPSFLMNTIGAAKFSAERIKQRNLICVSTNKRLVCRGYYDISETYKSMNLV